MFNGTALPTQSVPVLFSPDPVRLARFYAYALEFQITQHIVGVFALLRSPALPLQIWGRRDAKPTCTQVILEEGDPTIFDVHRQLARVAPALIDAQRPMRTPWGAWQFGMTDIDANQLLFMQWGPCPRAVPVAPERMHANRNSAQ